MVLLNEKRPLFLYPTVLTVYYLHGILMVGVPTY